MFGEAFANSASEDDLQTLLKMSGDLSGNAEVFVTHGNNLKTQQQTYLTNNDAGYINKKDNKKDQGASLGTARVLGQVLEGTPSALSSGGLIGAAIDLISSITRNGINTIEVNKARETAETEIQGDLDFNDMMGGIEERLDMAPRNADGTLMNEEQKAIFEDENSMCVAPTAGEIMSTHTDAQDIMDYEAKLADPEARALLTADDVPERLIQEIKEERMQEMFDSSLELREEAFDKIAEENGFKATEDKTAYEVYQEALSNNEVPTEVFSKILDSVMDVNAAYEAEFEAQWADVKDQHAQDILKNKLEEIEANGGVYTPETSLDKNKIQEELAIGEKFQLEQNNLLPTADSQPIVSQSNDVSAAPVGTTSEHKLELPSV